MLIGGEVTSPNDDDIGKLLSDFLGKRNGFPKLWAWHGCTAKIFDGACLEVGFYLYPWVGLTVSIYDDPIIFSINRRCYL